MRILKKEEAKKMAISLNNTKRRYNGE